MAEDFVWIHGAFDSLLRVLDGWYRAYDKGRVITYRKVFDGTEELIGNEPREREITIDIRDMQFEAIVKLLSIIYPNSIEYAYFKDFYTNHLKKFKRVQGVRSVPMVVPKHVVKGLRDLFVEFRSGSLKLEAREIPAPKKDNKPTLLQSGSTKTQGLFAEGGGGIEELKKIKSGKEAQPVDTPVVTNSNDNEDDVIAKIYAEMENN